MCSLSYVNYTSRKPYFFVKMCVSLYENYTPIFFFFETLEFSTTPPSRNKQATRRSWNFTDPLSFGIGRAKSSSELKAV